MDINSILIAVGVLIASNAITFFITNRKANNKLSEYKTIAEGIEAAQKELALLADNISEAESKYQVLDNSTKELQELKVNAEALASDVKKRTAELSGLMTKLKHIIENTKNKEQNIQLLISKLDLYSRIEEFVDNGHFEMPEYLFETSARFIEEIKRVREKQKQLIKDKEAITYPETTMISKDKTYNKKILAGQVKLMLSSFNIECDTLIGKVTPSSLPRTLVRIEKLANSLEKSSATLECGFNIEYVKLKYEECRLQFQNSMKRKEEQDEQKLIREQIREEQKAIKEYERAIAKAEKEEKMYRDMLKKAREELSKVTDDERIIAEQRIADLEAQLAEAEATEERAKSMAEQTRKGHVYVISNIGSFGDGIYKIGLTRRLEPIDRVKELGDASVPFTFDVHAMIYVEDAPALESALHREFTNRRVNAVNFRKEFFRIDLESIKKAVDKIAGLDADFKMTAIAEDYYETRRLQSVVT